MNCGFEAPLTTMVMIMPYCWWPTLAALSVMFIVFFRQYTCWGSRHWNEEGIEEMGRSHLFIFPMKACICLKKCTMPQSVFYFQKAAYFTNRGLFFPNTLPIPLVINTDWVFLDYENKNWGEEEKNNNQASTSRASRWSPTCRLLIWRWPQTCRWFVRR